MDSSINVYVSAREATALLGVKRETLYAYVSRGWVRSVPGATRRERRYARADLERLKARHDARAGHAAVAGAALLFGEPVLDSAITRIDERRGPIYRGRAAVELASFEEAVALLWQRPALSFAATELGVPTRTLAAMLQKPAPLELLAAYVPLLAARDPARFHVSTDIDRGTILLERMAAALALAHDPARVRRALNGSTVAETVARALGCRGRDAVAAIDLALLLSADHELNPSTFAARVAASAGADLYACVSAALATLSGPRHGGTCDRIEAIVASIDGSTADAARVVQERARRGEDLPGFGHRLYPAGDPRAPPLLDAARALSAKDVRPVIALVRAMRDAGREAPTLDLGLVAIATALRLPRGSSLALFAIGRTAGWIAHVLEQRASQHPLRPRARYVGV